MDARKAAIDIFLSGVNSVKPDRLIRRLISFNNDILTIKNTIIPLDNVRDLYVIGGGKASASMASELEFILGNRIKDGFIVTKYHHSVPLNYIRIKEAGHPVPDCNGLEGTKEILDIAHKAGEKDLVICLISGGGSALLTDLPEGCTLKDLATLNNVLLECGASINEMNCIRKHLSTIKGGLLSKAVWPATIISLILSDVIGDQLDVIASGPTAPDPSTFAMAVEILNKYQIEDKIPPQIFRILQEGVQKKRGETLKENDEAFKRTSNIIIGSNTLALQKAKEKAVSIGYEARVITSSLEGDINEVAACILDKVENICKFYSGERICLLFGGEPTLEVTTQGKGGRNQHLALILAKKIKGMKDITFLSAGTDGTDGPTDAAGAVVDTDTYKYSAEQGLDIDKYLENFDSYNFFSREGGLIRTGPTQTNVMDLMIVLLN